MHAHSTHTNTSKLHSIGAAAAVVSSQQLWNIFQQQQLSPQPISKHKMHLPRTAHPFSYSANPSPNPPTCQPNAPSTAPRPFRSFVQLATGTATATATTTLLHSCLSLLLHVHWKKESKLWGFLKEMFTMSYRMAYRTFFKLSIPIIYL